MFKKNKRLIAIILIFTISFTTYTMVQEKQVQAVAVVDDLTLFLILATVVIATGINVTSKDQAKHMGSMVFDEFKKLGGTIADLSVETYEGVQGLKIGDKLKQAVKNVYDSIPRVDTDLPIVGDFQGSFNIKGTSVPALGQSTPSSSVILQKALKVGTLRYSQTAGKISFNINSLRFTSDKYAQNYTGLVFYAFTTYYSWLVRTLYVCGIKPDGSLEVINSSNWVDGNNVISSSSGDLTFTKFETPNIIKYSDSVIWENADVTKLDTTIPYTDTNSGFIPFPTTDTTIFDSATHDTPITWDKVADVVVDFPVDTTVPPVIDGDITGDGTIVGDDTIVGDGTLVGEGTLDVPKVAKLDFSPLYINLKDKFPFCIPFDLYNMVAGFNAPKVAPHFTIIFPEKTMVGGGSFEFNFDNYSKIVLIFRYFILLTFLVNLIKISRKVMGAE